MYHSVIHGSVRLLYLLSVKEVIWRTTLKHAFSMFYTLIKHGFLTNQSARRVLPTLLLYIYICVCVCVCVCVYVYIFLLFRLRNRLTQCVPPSTWPLRAMKRDRSGGRLWWKDFKTPADGQLTSIYTNESYREVLIITGSDL